MKKEDFRESKRDGVSVIIPTLGRSSINQVLNSIECQTKPVSEIIIVVDGAESSRNFDRAFNKSAKEKQNIHIYHIPKSGVSAAFNYGLTKANFKYVCIASDDDLWLPRKIELQIRVFEDRPQEKIAVLTKCKYRRRKRFEERPKNKIKEHESPLSYLFKKRNLSLYSKQYLPMSTLIFSTAGGTPKFNPTLTHHEDILYLEELFQDKYTIIMLDEPTLITYPNFLRSKSRVVKEDVFGEILQSVNLNYFRNYSLYTITRSAISTGDIKELIRILRKNLNDYQGVKLKSECIFIGLVQILMTILFRARGLFDSSNWVNSRLEEKEASQ